MPAYKDSKRGTWYIKTRLPDPVTGENRQILKRGFNTKRDALLWEAQQKTAADPRASLTFDELAQKYFDYRDQRPRTRKQQEAQIRLYWPHSNKKVTEITKQICMDWYLQMDKKEDLANSSKNYAMGIIKSVFKYGSDFYDLPHPMRGLKRWKTGKSEMEVWNVDEFNKFLPYTEGHYRNLFLFIYCTGLRKSEAIGLQYTDFLPDGRVHVWRQLTPQGYSDLKTDSSERKIKLTAFLRAYMEPVLKECGPDKPFVFGWHTSLCHTTVHDKFKEAIEASGVKEIRIHDLRHSFATNAISEGCNIVAVSKYLGHSDINITLRTYAHLLEKTSDEMVGIMDGFSKNGIKMVSQPSDKA